MSVRRGRDEGSAVAKRNTPWLDASTNSHELAPCADANVIEPYPPN